MVDSQLRSSRYLVTVSYHNSTSNETQERAESMGYATFALLFGFLDIGFVVVRVAGLIALSGSSGVAASLVLISMSPSVVLPLLTYARKLAGQRGNAPDGEGAEM